VRILGEGEGQVPVDEMNHEAPVHELVQGAVQPCPVAVELALQLPGVSGVGGQLVKGGPVVVMATGIGSGPRLS
jgi:hypothetical protein